MIIIVYYIYIYIYMVLLCFPDCTDAEHLFIIAMVNTLLLFRGQKKSSCCGSAVH